MDKFVTQSRNAKVLHVIAHMEKGGAERQLMLLTQASRHCHVIMVLDGNEQSTSSAVELLPSLRNPLSVERFTRDVIHRHQIDIVQLWLPDRMTIPAMVAALRERCQIISGDRRKVRSWGWGAIRDRVNYVNHFASDIVIPNYPYLAPKLSLRRLLCIPRKARVILNGVATSIRNQELRGLPHRLLFVGRLVSQKRVVELIEILPRLMEEAGVSGLDVVGEGPEELACRDRIKRHGLENFVSLHGRLSMWGERFSPQNNLLILPSTSEGMSNTLFEAIAWGFLPLISRSSELDTILQDWEHKPEMFNPWKPKSVVAAVARSLSCDVDEANIRIRAMQSRLADFSVSEMAERYDIIYDGLISTRAAL